MPTNKSLPPSETSSVLRNATRGRKRPPTIVLPAESSPAPRTGDSYGPSVIENRCEPSASSLKRKLPGSTSPFTPSYAGAPSGPEPYYAVFDLWAPVWRGLTPDASRKVRLGNYQRIFDEGRRRVRAWEMANVR